MRLRRVLMVVLGLTVLAGGLLTLASAAQAGPATVVRGQPTRLHGALYQVAAGPAGTAWAVGSTGVCQPKTLIARWNGTAWTVVPTPAGTRRGQLYSTAVTSARNAWAVGYSGSLLNPHRSLLLHWNGTAWTRAVTPSAEGGVSLVGVTATSATHAWAVGDTGHGRVFILDWNGRVWQRMHVPAPWRNAALTDVAATSARNVWAVGAIVSKSGAALILHWNGTAWTRVPVRDVPSGSVLQNVTATSTGQAWAVGFTGTNKTLILRWNGVAWLRAAEPDISGGLTGVTAVSPHDAWAVGGTDNFFAIGCSGAAVARVGGLRLPGLVGRQANPKLRPLIYHWNGAAWEQVASPAQSEGGLLIGVEATSAHNAWAVGGVHFLQRAGKVLILRWNGKTWK